MESFGNLDLSWQLTSLPTDATNIVMLNKHSLVYNTDVCINELNTTNGTHSTVPIATGRCIACIATHPSTGLIAYSEKCLQPSIILSRRDDSGSYQVMGHFEGVAEFAYTHIEFTVDSKYLLAVSAVPNPCLHVWEVSNYKLLSSAVMKHCARIQEMHCNPVSSKSFTLLAQSGQLIIYCIDKCGDLATEINHTIIELPSLNADVGNETHPESDILSANSLLDSIEQFPYKIDSDFLDEDLKSSIITHCWTQYSTIYALSKSAILSVEAESGILTVVHMFAQSSNDKPLQQEIDSSNTDTLELWHHPTPRSIAVINHKIIIGFDNGDVRLMDAQDNFSQHGHIKLDATPLLLLPDPTCSTLIIVTHARQAYITNLPSLDQFTPITMLDGCNSINSIDVLSTFPDAEYIITGKEDSSLYCIDSSTGSVLSCAKLSLQITSFITLKNSPVLIAGTSTGEICALSYLSVTEPDVCLMNKLYSVPIGCMGTDVYSQIIITAPGVNSHADTETSVFIIDGRVSNELNIIARMTVSHGVHHMHLYTDNIGSPICIALMQRGEQATLITSFTFNPSWLDATEDEQSLYFSDPITKLLNNKAIDYVSSCIENQLLSGLLITSPSKIFSINVATGRLTKLVLREQLQEGSIEQQEQAQSLVWSVDATYSAHSVLGMKTILPNSQLYSSGSLAISPHQVWLGSVCQDGRFTIRQTTTPESGYIDTTLSHFSSACATLKTVFSADSQNVYLLSNIAGGVTSLRWNMGDSIVGRQKLQAGIASMNKRHNTLKHIVDAELQYLQRTQSIAAIHFTPCILLESRNLSITNIEISPTPENNDDNNNSNYVTSKEGVTWLEKCIAEQEAKESEVYENQKSILQNELNQLKQTVQDMIASNDSLSQIEKLERHEFVLDVERIRELKLSQDNEIARREEEIHLQNLSKLYLKEKIEEQCWSTMQVQGKTLHCFNGSIQVDNFPIRSLTSSEKLEKQNAIERQRILKECKDAREDLEPDLDLSHLISRVAQMFDEKLDEETEDRDEDQRKTPGGDDIAASTTNVNSTKTAILVGDEDFACLEGRGASQYGGHSFPEVVTQFQNRSIFLFCDQVLVLQDSVVKIKQHFNTEFEEILNMKESEVMRINERYDRIYRIIADLKQKHGVELERPANDVQLHAHEIPESLLEVTDGELRCERYVTKEEKEKQLEQSKLDEERRISEIMDKWRDRGIDQMMGGKLELDTEDELFKELIEPEILMDAKFTSDPELQAKKKEWNTHVEKILEDRQKHRRGLEAEMSKLEQAIKDGRQRINEKISQLYKSRILHEDIVYQEEMKIVSLLASQMFIQELAKEEGIIIDTLDNFKQTKVQKSQTLRRTFEYFEKFNENYSVNQLDDRNLDRNFKREHSDMEPHVDTLYRLFKKRPRLHKKPGLDEGLSHDSIATSTRHPSNTQQKYQESVAELDLYSNSPEGLDLSSWERFTVYRRNKIDSEQRLKKQALELAELQSYYHKKEREEEKHQNDIESLYSELSKIKTEKNRVYFNLQVQLLLKQGQIEVDSGDFLTDHSDSILIGKPIVEELNKNIKLLGAEKLEKMEQNIEFKKGIHYLEWEHRKYKFQADDLQKKAREIQTLRLSKDVQRRMQEAESVEKDSKGEIEMLEENLEKKKIAHSKKLDILKFQLLDLDKDISKRASSNSALAAELSEVSVMEAERSRLVNRDKHDVRDISKKRLRSVMHRRKMLDLAKSQLREISALRSELERLRLKTFPALLQLD